MADSHSGFFGLKIFPKMFISMVCVALIPLGSLWYINNVSVQDEWKSNIETGLRKEASVLVDTVEAWVDGHRLVLQQNALLADMISMEAEKQNPILKTINKAYAETYLLFTIDGLGQNIGRNDGKETKFYGDRQYVKQVLRGDDYGQQVLISRTTGAPAYILSNPIKDEQKNLIGVLAMGVTLVEMSTATTDIKLGDTGFAMLLDDTGKVIAHGKPELLQETMQDFSAHPVFSQSADGQLIEYSDNDQRVISYVRKTQHGWTLAVQQNYEEAYAPLNEAKQNALYLLLATIVLVALVAVIVARRLVNPLLRLTKIADGISRGQVLSSIDEAKRSDEIGGLARSIQRLGVSIQMAARVLRKIHAQQQGKG